MLPPSDALKAYRAQLATCAPLPEEEERRLALEFKRGVPHAGEKLARACLPFVVSIAMEYRRWGVPMEDIIQQGNMGLLRAIERFDPDRSCRLITYASYWIRAEIRDYLVRTYRVVRLGTTKAERRALRLYRTTREEDSDALAKASGLSPARAARLMPVLSARDVSLDTESGNLRPVQQLMSLALGPEEEACSHELQGKLKLAFKEVFQDLSERERLIIEERWASEDPLTLEHLGERLGISKERVRQIEERTKQKVRARLISRGIEPVAA